MKRASWWARLAPGLATPTGYDRRSLPKDVLSRLSVAAIALPVGLAYADLAGVPAIVGIYSAIFPLLAYALFGSSRQLIVGPDAATCLLVAANLAPLAAGDPGRYLALLPVFTLMTGVLYLLAGAARLGFIAALSQPILTGYLNGIALIILVGQLPKLLGYPTAADEFVLQLRELVERVGLSQPPTALLGVAMLAGLLVLGRVAPAVPGALIAVVAGIGAVAFFDLQPVFGADQPMPRAVVSCGACIETWSPQTTHACRRVAPARGMDRKLHLACRLTSPLELRPIHRGIGRSAMRTAGIPRAICVNTAQRAAEMVAPGEWATAVRSSSRAATSGKQRPEQAPATTDNPRPGPPPGHWLL